MVVAVSPLVEALCTRLAEALDAEEVILFGSRARGEARADSDADILVITPAMVEARTVVETVSSFRQAHPGTPSAQVTARTVEQLRAVVRAGSLTMREALREGVVLAGARSGPSRAPSAHTEIAREWSRVGAVRQWLAKASADAEVARTALQQGHGWVAAFHAQQAAEKGLKALIVHGGGEPSRTHAIGDLLDQLLQLDSTVGARFSKSRKRLDGLTPYGVEARYPDVDVYESEARAAVASAEEVLDEVRRVVGHA